MDVAVFSTKPYDRRFLDAANADGDHAFAYFEPRLTPETAALAGGSRGVCAFVNDVLDRDVLERLADGGTEAVVLRSAGFNNVDLVAAEDLGLAVGRVPAYSPHAVAEHTLALLLALDRRLHRAYNRVREGNFALDGLLGFDLHGRTVGVVGTGKIGAVVVKILGGFGCRVLTYDPYPNEEVEALGATYVALEGLLAAADVVTLHCPLTPETHHLIDADALAQMRPGAVLVNTSRGALVDTPAVIEALKSGHLGALAIDVYEEEADLFFEDLSDTVLRDDVFARLLTFPNVLVTGHQAFFTEEALTNIAETTVANLTAFEQEGRVAHPVTAAVAYAAR
ncbi:MAG: 2-hydroxyacid dehydrogenase [Rhodothermales bacterium]|nr:2-hydroxyacid dehydrogenase [Rhodothermales bacterium]